MKLEEYTTTLPAYTIGDHAYEAVDRICALYGKKAVAIGGPRGLAAFKKAYESAKQKTEITDYIIFSREANVDEANELARDERIRNADMVFSCGGGKSMDFGKVVAHEAGKPHFTFPTIAATCAPITRVTVLYHADHTYAGQQLMPKPPIHCFINTKVIAEAPEVYLWAGIGDTLAKNCEAQFASRGHELDHANWLGLTIAPMSSDGLVFHATKGLEDCRENKSTYELEQSILAIIVSTGLVSINVNDEYNGSLAHAIYYGLTHDEEIDAHHLHGEVVSYGVLVLLTLDKQIEERNKIHAFMKSVGLPTCLADLKITRADIEGIADLILEDPVQRIKPYPISREMLMNAVDELEAYGKKELK